MNKTININLGGLFFHIDEVAFKKLRHYLDTIRRSLSDDPKGKDEIIADIELRISELLSAKVKDPRQVISEADIDDVINVMGQPEDYIFEEENFSRQSSTNTNYQSYNGKKLFRDGEDKFLGGVASGIAHYFSVEPIWIRLCWLVLSFGFGFGFLLYIILWILLPEANTTAEKLQMEGEAVNINTIEKKIRDEFQNVSEHAKKSFADASAKVKESLDDATGKVKEGMKASTEKVKKKDIKSGFQELIDVIGKIITTFFMVIGKFVGIILIIVSLSSLIGLTIGLFTTGTLDLFGFDWFIHDDFGFFNSSGLPIWVISIMILLLVGIPFLMLFFLGMFILSSRTKTPGKVTWYVLLGLWLMTVIATIVVGVRETANFAFNEYHTETVSLNTVKIDTLNVKMIDNQDISNYSRLRSRRGYKRVLTDNNKDMLYSNYVRLNIRKSDTESSYIKIRKEGEGSSRINAKGNAKKLDYQYTLKGDNLNFNGYFLTKSRAKFINQVIMVTLYVPQDKVIYLDQSTQSFLRNVENTDNTYDSEMSKHYYKMTQNEGLDCLDCED